MTPEISVVIPCFNPGSYVFDAIASVREAALRQNCPIEIVIVNDHSTDSAALAILADIAKDDGLRVVENKGNRGVAAARNCGISAASGKWIAFIDADDVWTPDSLKARCSAISAHPDIAWVGADYVLQHEGGPVDSDSFYLGHPAPLHFLREAFDRDEAIRLTRPVEAVLQVNLTWVGTVMVTRAMLQSVGGFDETLRKSEDTALWITLSKKTDLLFVPQVCAVYKQRAGSLCHDNEAPYDWEIKVFNAQLREPLLASHKAIISVRLLNCLEENIMWYRRQGRRMPALRHTVQALKLAPARLRSWKNLAASVLGK